MLLHAWRSLSFKSVVRIAPALLLAILCTIGFTLAGGYSSQIQLRSDNIGSAVLLDGTNCSVIGRITSMSQQNAYEKLAAGLIGTANNYVQQCYSANSTGLTDCNYFVSQRLPGFMNDAAPCPFRSSLCRSNSNNLALDTGFLDTDAHFGLNAPPEERLLIRHKLQCAPLLTKGHVSLHGNYTRYDYGPAWAEFSTESEEYSIGRLNYTYEVPNLDNQYTVMNGDMMIEQSYMLRSVTLRLSLSPRMTFFLLVRSTSILLLGVFQVTLKHILPSPVLLSPFLQNCARRSLFADTINGTLGASPTSGFLPSAEFDRPDADIFIVFLSGHGVFFSEPLHDEWYRATEPFDTLHNMVDEDSVPVYRTTEPASPLGCASQWQFCNKDNSACGPTASYHDALSGATGAFGSNDNESDENQSPAMNRLRWLLASTGIQGGGEDTILLNLQDSALLSKQSLFSGYQAPLPETQWKLDVTNWFSIYLALIQSNLLQTASGMMEAEIGIEAAKPTTEAALSSCSNQVCFQVLEDPVPHY